MTSTKPYDIAKRTIWEAYQRVKANRGTAGIDGETIAMFEQDLSRNLYKLWNRMSSGSYFPPPVKQVEIPKATGGIRKLGVPTVADRVGQTAVKLLIEPILDPLFRKRSTDPPRIVKLISPDCMSLCSGDDDSERRSEVGILD